VNESSSLAVPVVTDMVSFSDVLIPFKEDDDEREGEMVAN
jgi:hypothetical protein